MTATSGNNAVDITDEEIFFAHKGGKLDVGLTSPLETQKDLSIAYTPGVAKVSRAIAADRTKAGEFTWASRLVAIISDGSAVLGLGDIGPSASLPVMEGKAALFKKYSGLNAIPIVLETKDVDEIVETVKRLQPSFGAVNLEDISAPRCFDIEERLINELDIPVMHDDQHGTAVVVLAALLNAVKLADRDIASLKVVISGAGAAGVAITEILLGRGITDIVIYDSTGAIYAGREGLTGKKLEYAQRTNPRKVTGDIGDGLHGADVFIGVSSSTVEERHLGRMADDAIVFALSNPDPEVDPDVAEKYATVVATGRSDYPNQINNVLAFPGIFLGAFDAGAKTITQEMKLAAAEAIAAQVGDDLSANYIIPTALDPRVAPAVAEAVENVASRGV